MPRLILIEGPQTGEFFQLGAENYLGGENGAVRFSRAPDLHCKHVVIHLYGQSYHLRRLEPVPVMVNGDQVDQTVLNHGDLVTLGDAVMIFDSDAPTNAQQGSGFGEAAGMGGDQQAGGDNNGPMDIAAMGGGSDFDQSNLEGTISIRRSEEPDDAQIRYRQKVYDDPDAVLHGMDGPDTNRRLATLFKVSSAVAAILDLEELLNKILELVFEELPADRGSILLFSREDRKLRTMAQMSRDGSTEQVRISRTIVTEAIRTKESILCLDAMSDERFNMGLSIVDQNIRSAMCTPLVLRDQVLGIIFVDTSEQTQAFSRKDLDLLSGIAMQAALAIENARLYKEVREKERLKCEVDLASSIQKHLLPKRLPRSRELEVYGRMIPAKEVGGDYFDFHINYNAGILNIIVGDVTGKGLGAGVIMAMARSYLRPLCSHYTSPKQVMTEANSYLYQDTNQGLFMSALLCSWNEREKKMIFTGCGHEHLMIYRARERRTERRRAGGIALGLIENAGQHLKDEELPLESGDAIVLYTDGVTEAKSANGEFFGLDNLQRLTDVYGHLSAKELLEAILWELKSFIGNAEQHDDITIVTIKKR